MPDAVPVNVRPVPVTTVVVMTPVVVMTVMMMAMVVVAVVAMAVGHGLRSREHGRTDGHDREHRRLDEARHDVPL